MIRGTRAYSSHRDTASSAIRRSPQATSPESVNTKRSSATTRVWHGGTFWAARPTPRLCDPPHWVDIEDGYHNARPLGLSSTQPTSAVWLLYGLTNRKRSLERCPLTQPVGALTARADGLPKQFHRDATTECEWTRASCRRPSDHMRRLSRHPMAPHVGLLRRGKIHPIHLLHNDHLERRN